MNPHQVTKDFERAIADYTGAPHVVCVNSCTAAIMLAVAWHMRLEPGRVRPRPPSIEIPRRTYVSVPMSIIHAGGRPGFRDEDWLGAYQLKPLPVWDSARWFTHGLWRATHIPGSRGQWFGPGSMVCVSFHAAKTLGIEQGGAILLDNPEADAWLRRARFDGRTEGVAPNQDEFTQIGWHCYMNPSTAAQGLLRMHSINEHNDPLPNDPYPDLSTMEIFR